MDRVWSTVRARLKYISEISLFNFKQDGIYPGTATSRPPSSFQKPKDRFATGLMQIQSQHNEDFNPPMPRPPLFSAWWNTGLALMYIWAFSPVKMIFFHTLDTGTWRNSGYLEILPSLGDWKEWEYFYNVEREILPSIRIVLETCTLCF